MTEPRDHCQCCGASWKDEDFGTDGDGRIVDLHICDRRTVEAYRRQLPPRPEQQRRGPMSKCLSCGQFYRPLRHSQKWCHDCGPIMRKKQDAERYRRNTAA